MPYPGSFNKDELLKIALFWGKYDDIENVTARIDKVRCEFIKFYGLQMIPGFPPRHRIKPLSIGSWRLAQKMVARTLSTSSRRDKICPWKSYNSVCACYVVTKYQKLMLKIMKYNGCRSCWLKKSLLNDPVIRCAPISHLLFVFWLQKQPNKSYVCLSVS